MQDEKILFSVDECNVQSKVCICIYAMSKCKLTNLSSLFQSWSFLLVSV